MIWNELKSLESPLVSADPSQMTTPALLFTSSPQGFLIFPDVRVQSPKVGRISPDGAVIELLSNPLSAMAQRIHSETIRRSREKLLSVDIAPNASESAIFLTRGRLSDNYFLAWTVLDFTAWSDRQSHGGSLPSTPSSNFARVVASADGRRVALLTQEKVFRNYRLATHLFASAPDNSGSAIPFGTINMGVQIDKSAWPAYFHEDLLSVLSYGGQSKRPARVRPIDCSNPSRKPTTGAPLVVSHGNGAPLLFRDFAKVFSLHDLGRSVISIPDIGAAQVDFVEGVMRLWDSTGNSLSASIAQAGSSALAHIDRAQIAGDTGRALLTYCDIKRPGGLTDADVKMVLVFRARNSQLELPRGLVLWECSLSNGLLSITEKILPSPPLRTSGKAAMQPWRVAAGRSSSGLAILVCQGRQLWLLSTLSDL
jgi:hypothetical protein